MASYSEAFGADPDALELQSGGASRVAGWLGALSSAALIAGLAYWVHDLATRDARAVPVVRALEGPSRVPPDDPGGFTAAHKGFAVNSVASDTPAALVSEEIVLAPQPVGPAPEDTAPPEQAAAAVPADDPALRLRNAIDGALSEVLGLDAPISAPAPAQAAPQPQSAKPRPSPRPDPDLVTRSLSDLGLPALAPRPASVDPALIAPGTRLVQLGSFSTPDVAQTEWARLSDQFDHYLRSKSRVIVPAEHAGLTVYRLQAMGFDSLSEARSFCAVLLAEKADCIPVLTR